MRAEVLDKGFVELIDVMGDDQAVVDAARVSVAGEGVKPVSSNEGLIRYLMRNRHTTPFEMAELKWRVKAPIFVLRQWHRHRTASVNEQSARYGEVDREWYVPNLERCRDRQSSSNKQGSEGRRLNITAQLHQGSHDVIAENGFDTYQQFLHAGAPRELARAILPQAMYSTMIWKSSLHNLFHFIGLRAHPHAQYEIRVYAEAMLEMVKERFPLCTQAFLDYRMNAMTLTAYDIDAIKRIGWGHTITEEDFPTKREYNEFLGKQELLGVGL